jgi:hypothetical protein
MLPATRPSHAKPCARLYTAARIENLFCSTTQHTHMHPLGCELAEAIKKRHDDHALGELLRLSTENRWCLPDILAQPVDRGRTMLQVAIEKGAVEVAEAVREMSVVVGCFRLSTRASMKIRVNVRARSPLEAARPFLGTCVGMCMYVHCASPLTHCHCVPIHPQLLHHGAAANDTCASRGGALHAAVETRNLRLMELLLAKGAIPWQADGVSRNAFDVALCTGWLPAVERLQSMAMFTGAVSMKVSGGSINIPRGGERGGEKAIVRT